MAEPFSDEQIEFQRAHIAAISTERERRLLATIDLAREREIRLRGFLDHSEGGENPCALCGVRKDHAIHDPYYGRSHSFRSSTS